MPGLETTKKPFDVRALKSSVQVKGAQKIASLRGTVFTRKVKVFDDFHCQAQQDLFVRTSAPIANKT